MNFCAVARVVCRGQLFCVVARVVCQHDLAVLVSAFSRHTVMIASGFALCEANDKKKGIIMLSEIQVVFP
jgi:hypothetical protein